MGSFLSRVTLCFFLFGAATLAQAGPRTTVTLTAPLDRVKNTGAVGDVPSVSGNIIAFQTSEAQAGMDLNGDGDTNDFVIRYYDIATDVVTLAVGEDFVEASGFFGLSYVSGDIITFGEFDELVSGGAFVLKYYQIPSGPITNIGAVGLANDVLSSVSGDIIAFPTSEALIDTDLNSDGDKFDRVIRYYEISTSLVTNTGAIGEDGASVSGDIIAFTTSEALIDTDLNSDGDTNDFVIRYYDIENTSAINTGAVGRNPSVDGDIIAFTTSESAIGVDLNGDGDTNDGVLRYYKISTDSVINTGVTIFGVRARPSVSGDIIAFSHTGRRLSAAVAYYDIPTDTLVDTGVPGGSFASVSGDIITFPAFEFRIGVDLNGDGDTNDLVIIYLEIDSDEDGILDSVDTCPFLKQPVDFSGPEPVLLDPDSDGDGFGDMCDECPNDPPGGPFQHVGPCLPDEDDTLVKVDATTTGAILLKWDIDFGREVTVYKPSCGKTVTFEGVPQDPPCDADPSLPECQPLGVINRQIAQVTPDDLFTGQSHSLTCDLRLSLIGLDPDPAETKTIEVVANFTSEGHTEFEFEPGVPTTIEQLTITSSPVLVVRDPAPPIPIRQVSCSVAPDPWFTTFADPSGPFPVEITLGIPLSELASAPTILLNGVLCDGSGFATPVFSTNGSTTFRCERSSAFNALGTVVDGNTAKFLVEGTDLGGDPFEATNGNICTVGIVEPGDAERPVTSGATAFPNPAPFFTDILLTALVDDSTTALVEGATTGGSTITGAVFTVDGAGATAMVASDGAFDETIEAIEGTIPAFSTAGIRDVCVTGIDEAGNASDADCLLLPVFDPSGSFVTGGGWIDSPQGAYTSDPTLIGKASFGFVSKYAKKKQPPEGQTEFRFVAGNLNFHSTSYEWLVISGPRAQYKGDGTVNGEPGFGFLLTAIDGDRRGGDGVDRFRMKIIHKASDTLLYDNRLGLSDTSDDITALAGGSILIHTKKKK